MKFFQALKKFFTTNIKLKLLALLLGAVVVITANLAFLLSLQYGGV